MYSLTIKTTCNGNHVNTTLANPSSPLGDIRDASVQIRRVNKIPDSIDKSQVIRLFAGTCDISQFSCPRLEFDFSEFGIGRIVK